MSILYFLKKKIQNTFFFKEMADNKKGTPIEDLDKIIHYANILKDKLNW